ncbi:MAG TPA: iron-containing alcohol dehydrogenase [Candidatus Bathyarchaeia archaeon]|nr:iron-containing alcohol dehydrogenase [Candidatus Bathyarchaeia archaeon]
MAHEFWAPRIIVTGAGCASEVGKQAKSLGGSRALLVTDKGVRAIGLVDQVVRAIETSGLMVEVFDDVPREPEMGFVESGLEIFKRSQCDVIVTLGGGSPMDVAKAIAVLATSGGSVRDYEGQGKVLQAKAPLIAMPTTGGTGSEVTRFTIVTDVERKRKMLIGDPKLIPEVAICDPTFSLTVPPSLTIGTGMDALTHAIEAFVSVRAQPITDHLCLAAIKLISRSIRRAWKSGNDLEARGDMMMGSTLAGLAFSNSSVALVHGMSRPIGAHFHLPHGLSNAVLLPTVMEYSSEGNPEKYGEIAAAMGERTEGCSSVEAARSSVTAIRRLSLDLEVPTLSGVGIDRSELRRLAPKMAEDALASGSPGNNPRRASKEDIVALYEKAY